MLAHLAKKSGGLLRSTHTHERREIAMSEVNMPRLSDTMQEGTIARWLKKAGDEIKKGDILAEIETDKATMDLESYDAGVLEQVLVQEGETVPVGQAVAVIGSGKDAGKGQGGQKQE